MRTGDLFKFIRERHAIYERRTAGQSKPWTKDPILQQYRFCNVYRELDTVTIWIRENWRERLRFDPDLWFAMVLARLINWPDSLSELTFNTIRKDKVVWKPEKFVETLAERKVRGEKVFTGAYMIHAGPETGAGKPGYLAESVLTPMWEKRADIRPRKGDTLESFHARLMTCKDMGSFMAGQVVADAKHATIHLQLAEDRDTWCAIGPGSAKGMNYVLERDPLVPFTTHDWGNAIFGLQSVIQPMIKRAQMPFLDAQDLQNCLCEFSKYERTRLGLGRPRSKYQGV